MNQNVEIERMTAREYLARAQAARGVILPLGSTEILGGHGPLGADALAARSVAPEIARRCNCLSAAAIPYGDTLELSGFPGTAHVPARILEDYLYAVCASSLFKPAGLIIFLSFHSLNLQAADAAARRLRADGRRVLAVDWWKAVSLGARDVLDDWENGRGHGGEMITSVIMYLAPDAVRLADAANEAPLPGLGRWAARSFSGGDIIKSYGDFTDYTTGGAWGDVSRASAEKGRVLTQRAIDRIAGAIREFSADAPTDS